MRLIDANALLKKCIEGDGSDRFTEGYNFAVQEISEYIALAPTIEPKVRHGYWIIRGGDMWYSDMRCSECGYEDVTEFGEPEDYRYCPNCGAKMDGGDSDAG